jgi:uncharacterized protein (DUF433 family)
MAEQKEWTHLERRPRSFYKQLFIKGGRIRAEILYGAFMNAKSPRTPEEIAADYGLPLEAVREAIAYCQTDPPEIRDDHRREDLLEEATLIKNPTPEQRGKHRLLTPEEWVKLGL